MTWSVSSIYFTSFWIILQTKSKGERSVMGLLGWSNESIKLPLTEGLKGPGHSSPWRLNAGSVLWSHFITLLQPYVSLRHSNSHEWGITEATSHLLFIRMSFVPPVFVLVSLSPVILVVHSYLSDILSLSETKTICMQCPPKEKETGRELRLKRHVVLLVMASQQNMLMRVVLENVDRRCDLSINLEGLLGNLYNLSL